METWLIITLVVLAILAVVIGGMYLYPPLGHRHRLAHEMAGFEGKSWRAVDITRIFWNISIDSVTPLVSPNGVNYDFVKFTIDNPSGEGKWPLSVFYNKDRGIYEGYCASNEVTKAEIVARARRMGCERAEEIAAEVASVSKD